MKIPGLILLLAFALCSTFAQAQPGDDWFAKNDRGNRYEGAYSRKVGNPSVNLVALTASSPKYKLGAGQKLKVAFYSPAVQAFELHAEELLVTQFYWMQVKDIQSAAGWNTFEGWQVDFMLKRLSLESRNLGVLVRLGDRSSRKFAPAQVSLEGETPEIKQYVAQLRLGRAAADGAYKIYRGESRTKASLILEQKIAAKSSGATFPVVIPVSSLGNQAGWFTVEVNLREKSTLDPFTYSFSFYHSIR